MRKIFSLWLLLVVGCIGAFASDKITFTASAPDAVAAGDQFRLSYTINTQNVKDVRIPSIKGFDILMGPNRSYNMQIINGKQTESLTFTYILKALAEGEYTIPGATITAEGNPMTSNAVHIKVLPPDKSTETKGKASGRSGSSTSISDTDLFIRAIVNKTTVYEQEALLLTYKIYTLVDLQRFDNVKLPDFKGFHSQEIELSNNRKWGLEHYKGRNYQTTIFRQFVLFPQQSGELTIDVARFDASVACVTPVSDPFEAFFNGGGNYVEVKKTIQTPKLTIQVKPLPAGKPADFSSGVGEFTMTSSINKSEVKTNEAVTIKVVISGTGNMKLISNPEVKFPENFEIYDPKVENKFRLTNEGLTGNKVIEYLAIPRDASTYTIPAINFSYFDIKSGAYKTLSSQPYELKVEKGSGNAAQTIANFTNKEDLRILNEDIRHIRLNDVKLQARGSFFFGSVGYWLCYLIPFALFVVVFVFYRRKIAANANIAKTRTKKANKVAVKRMKYANKLLTENKKDEFYDEVLRALWGYISDKLNMPVSCLSKENIEGELSRCKVEPVLIQEFLRLLQECEFARFAPATDNQAMDKIYSGSLEVIGKMENSIKC